MNVLHNIESKKKLKKEIFSDNVKRITLSFYKYFFIKDPFYFRNLIYINFNKLKILGRVYIAEEGINAQISVPYNFFHTVKNFLKKIDKNFKCIYLNKCLEENKKSFWVLVVKVKTKIVADGISNKNFFMNFSQKYLNAKEVNKMLKEKNSVLVDVRNNYEHKIGYFKNSVKFPGSTFRQQIKLILNYLSKFKEKNIILYCTGGIRCEKVASWLIFNGIKNVYQIKNGIIGYVKDAVLNNLSVNFKGKNFVFDSRMEEKVTQDILSNCKNCNTPNDSYTNCYNDSCHILMIQCQKCSEKLSNCCSSKCKRKIEA
ncbi:rhodanese-related sulfurtransferase [Buchnera aphidicola (Mindarus keteleerifoliae)]|uniref:oxygen-dependent tRNA uridine(34) hydroxylase TrhO n=1 Tax=Buchnera aphidicola TaxID=9 RepID=UPI0031B72CD5